MTITNDTVTKIAKLARINIDQESIPRYQQDLNNILKLIDQINSTNTKNIDPLAHPLEMKQRLRPDEVTETDKRQDFQAIAPEVEASLYLVPKVID